MKTAFLYAGQGSQKPGMGKDIYDAYPEIRNIFDLKPMGLDLKQLCFDADIETLTMTRHTQPCMGAFGAAVTQLLKAAGIVPDYAAGLSLGEYGALHAAGVFSAEDYVSLLAFRGNAMEEASRGIDSAMYAVLSLGEDEINAVLAESGGDVWCCNFNCPGQIVIGGEKTAVENAEKLCREKGARRCMPLKVGGPFHTPYMESAAHLLYDKLHTIHQGEMGIPVVFNATGGFLGQGETIADMLKRQIVAPVRFEQSLRLLLDRGVTTFVEIGPGKTLAGFLRKTDGAAMVYSIEDAESLENTINILKGNG